MSFSGASGVSFAGLGSGIDSESIISRIVQLEQRSVQRLQIQQTQLRTKQAAYDQYKSLLNTLRGAASDLNQRSSFDLIKGSSSDATVATVTVGSATNPGTYNLEVTQLAQAHKLGSAAQANATTALNLTGTFTVNGKEISVISSDTLTSIAAKINSAGAEVTASILNGGSGSTYLTLTANKSGAANSINVTDTSGTVASTLNFTTLLAAQDSTFKVDGISFTNSSNNIEGVIPGATINLLKTSGTTTLSLTRDSEGIRGKVDNFIKAYNAVMDYLDQVATFDKETLESGPLFSDSTVDLIQEQMFNGILQSPTGITGPYRNLLAVGIDIDSKGRLTLDSSKFDSAISTNRENVFSLFGSTATFDDSAISFVSSSSATKASGTAGYAINITQAATLGSVSSGIAFSSPSVDEEILKFNGALFGGVEYSITVAPGSTLSSLINQINTDSRLKDLVTASDDGTGKLKLTSKKYGSPGNFTVESNLTEDINNSGIGKTTLIATGLNVEGTINAEAATGNGQFLTGASTSSNKDADGLQLLITGTATGDRGRVYFAKGAGTLLRDNLDSALDIVGGFLTAGTSALQSQIDDLGTRITDATDAITRKAESLRRRFQAMEDALSRLQSQSSQLSSMLSSLQQR